MIGGLLIDVIVVVCGFWVFFDAANNKIGTYVATEGLHKCYKRGMPPVVWGLFCMFIIPFFIYLFRRKALISIAQQNPVETDKSRGFILLFLMVAIMELYSYREFLFYY